MTGSCVKELCRFCGQSDKKLKNLFDDKDFLKKYKLAVPLPVSFHLPFRFVVVVCLHQQFILFFNYFLLILNS